MADRGAEQSAAELAALSTTFLRVCSLCGRCFDTMEGKVYEDDEVHDLCHPFDAPDAMTCYHRWTVYGERP